MVVVLKRDATQEEIAALEKKLYPNSSPRGFDAKKYNGVLRLEEDPLTVQKSLRDEWERDFS